MKRIQFNSQIENCHTLTMQTFSSSSHYEIRPENRHCPVGAVHW